MKPLSSSAAQTVLQSRALQCSFSSVFHLRRAGMAKKEVSFVENLFVGTVGFPLVVMGAAGFFTMVLNDEEKKNAWRVEISGL
jgi:hypothetical protein